MRSDPGPLTLDELRQWGVLMEINRRVLQPVGLLGVARSDASVSFVRVATRGTGGESFNDTVSLMGRATAFRALESEEFSARFAAHGYLIQPFPGDPPRIVQAYTCDTGGIWPEVERMAAALVAVMYGDMHHDPAECIAAALPQAVIAPLLGRLSLVSIDGGATYQWRLQPPPQEVEDGAALARCHYLVAEIQRLQSGGDIRFEGVDADGATVAASDGIHEYVRSAKGELYESEVDEFAEARTRLDQLCGQAPTSDSPGVIDAGIDDVQRTLERIYENAQPGMRLYRGDDDAREAFGAHRERLRDAARGAVARMGEYDRLQAGELSDFEEADWPALDARLTAERDAAAEECAEIERQLTGAIQRREAADRSLSVVGRALKRRDAT